MTVSATPSSHQLIYPYLALPEDIRSLIVDRYFQLEDFIVLLDVSRPQRQAVITSVFSSIIWKKIQTTIGFQPPKEDKTLLSYQIITFVFIRTIQIQSLPPFLDKILKNPQILKKDEKGSYVFPRAALKATLVLLKWNQSRVEWVIFGKLAKEHGLNAPHLASLRSMREITENTNVLTQQILGNKAILSQIKILNLSSQQLSFLPESIGQLPSLQDLNLENNQLASLPQVISQLSGLRELRLGKNQQ